MRCYFKSFCDNPNRYICCNECDVKKCWQRCKDNPNSCGLVNDAPMTVEVTYYNIVNKTGKTKLYVIDGEYKGLPDGEGMEDLTLAEFVQHEAENMLVALNGAGRKVWSLVEARKEVVKLED